LGEEMKIRSGFVSNSSTSSFIIFTEMELDNYSNIVGALPNNICNNFPSLEWLKQDINKYFSKDCINNFKKEELDELITKNYIQFLNLVKNSKRNFTKKQCEDIIYYDIQGWYEFIKKLNLISYKEQNNLHCLYFANGGDGAQDLMIYHDHFWNLYNKLFLEYVFNKTKNIPQNFSDKKVQLLKNYFQQTNIYKDLLKWRVDEEDKSFKIQQKTDNESCKKLGKILYNFIEENKFNVYSITVGSDSDKNGLHYLFNWYFESSHFLYKSSFNKNNRMKYLCNH
jgi:hypothetical protein